MTIRDEEELMAYLKTMKDVHGLVGAVEYLDAGEEIGERLSDFFNNKKFEGSALFVGLYEGFGNMSNRNESFMISGQMTALVKFKDRSEMLAKRKKSREDLQKVIRKIIEEQEENAEDGQLFKYDFKVYANKFMPVTRPTNVDALGYNIDFEISFYPNI